jgi:hypothetical protein
MLGTSELHDPETTIISSGSDQAFCREVVHRVKATQSLPPTFSPASFSAFVLFASELAIICFISSHTFPGIGQRLPLQFHFHPSAEDIDDLSDCNIAITNVISDLKLSDQTVMCIS